MSEPKSVALESLLCSKKRDFLVRNNGDQVKVKELSGKTVGLYFSASWCPPCRSFTPDLAQLYLQLTSSTADLEIIYVSSDRDQESHDAYFGKMPWLAIPFGDRSIRRVEAEFEVDGIPSLVFVDGEGRVVSTEGVELVRDYGADAYPFTAERIEQLKEEDELARKNQTLTSLLVNDSRDYLITNDDKTVRVNELDGKMVCLYFTIGYGIPPFFELTKKLVEVYNHLREKGEGFEVVMVYLHDDEPEFKGAFAGMPWLSVPLKDKAASQKLVRHFDMNGFLRLVIIGPDGKTLNTDATEAIEEYGVEAFPFTPAKVAELEMARLELQTLESLLVTEDSDFVIGKSGSKVPVSDLVGKHVLMYFSAHWCPPCRGFTPKLVQVYHEIKAKESAFEVIFVSSDKDDDSFEEYFSSMPWLAVPFGDERKSLLSRRFKVNGIPALVALGPDGRTITKDARGLIDTHGADAFPFTEDHINKILQMNKDEEVQNEGFVCDGDVCRKA